MDVSMIKFLGEHWGWIAGVGIPLTVTVMATVANRFADPDNDPATPPPKWVRVVLAIADVLSWLDKNGKLSVPGLKTATIAAPPELKLVPPEPDKEKGSATASTIFWIGAVGLAILLGAMALMSLAGCAGFKAPAYGTLTTVVNAASKARADLPAACEAVANAAVDKAADRAGAMTAAKTVEDRCDTAALGIDSVVAGAKTARGLVTDTAAAARDPKMVLGWLRAALDGYANLDALLAPLGVKLPKIPGVN